MFKKIMSLIIVIAVLFVSNVYSFAQEKSEEKARNAKVDSPFLLDDIKELPMQFGELSQQRKELNKELTIADAWIYDSDNELYYCSYYQPSYERMKELGSNKYWTYKGYGILAGGKATMVPIRPIIYYLKTGLLSYGTVRYFKDGMFSYVEVDEQKRQGGEIEVYLFIKGVDNMDGQNIKEMFLTQVILNQDERLVRTMYLPGLHQEDISIYQKIPGMFSDDLPSIKSIVGRGKIDFPLDEEYGVRHLRDRLGIDLDKYFAGLDLQKDNVDNDEQKNDEKLENSNQKMEKHDKKSEVLNAFSDISVDHWAADDIQQAFDNKFVLGFEDGTFRPNKKLTDTEWIQMLYNFWISTHPKEEIMEDQKVTNDERAKNNIRKWYQDALDWAIYNGIVQEKEFLQQEIDRGKTIVLLNRMISNKKISIPVLIEKPAKFSETYEDKIVEEAINSLHDKGLISGYEDNTFRPDKKLSRVEAIVLIMRLWEFIQE